MRDRINASGAVAVAYVGVLFMSTMDTTIVNVALPAIGRSFAVPPTTVDGISVGYLVSLALFMPASGWLGDRYGRKRVLTAATVIFTLASALCGIADSLSELIAFRVLQGVGGGLLTPVGLAMLLRAYPASQRLRVSGLLAIPGMVAPATGPVLGGLLSSELSWRWVFYVNVPVGIAAVAFTAVFVRPDAPVPAGRFDLPGFALSSAGLGLLMYGVCEGPDQGWGSPRVLAAVAVGVAALLAMVRVELRAPAPIMAIRLLGNRLFRAGTVVNVLLSAGFISTLYLVSLSLQDGRGIGSLASGLTIFPEAIGMVAGSQLASRLLYRRLGPRRLIAAAATALTVVIVALAALSPDSSLWWARLLMFSCGLSMSQAYVGLQTVSFATISERATGYASTLFNSARQAGAATGVALLTTVIGLAGGRQLTAAHAIADPDPFRIALLVAAACSLACLPAALTISDADAAATLPENQHGKEVSATQPT